MSALASTPAAPPARPGRRAPVDAVVVGGSAGALEALQTLLPALPAGYAAAVVVVVHMQRQRPSLLTEVFAPRCALPVREAQHCAPVEAGAIVFAPPDYHLLIDAGPRLCLSVDAPLHFSRPAIDVLFESAADQFGERLIGVLLSGANADGAAGLATIGRLGGLTMVQSPASAQAPTMPQAGLAAWGVDYVLPPAGLAAALVQQVQRAP
jgi:two-component system chemotaxis response regulator CheB